MSTLPIDLSGRMGLAPRFISDLDRTVATPELRYLGADGQFAAGVFNPFRRYGYMSPANNTYTDITQARILTTTLGGAVTWQTAGISITPSGSTAPTLTGSINSGVEDTADTSFTLSHTTDSSSSMLVVAVQSMTGANPTGVTWDGIAMTQGVATGTNGFISIWYYNTPGAKSANIVATWAANTAEKSIHAMNINGGNGVNAIGGSSATSALATITLTPTVGNTLMVIATGSTNTTHAPGINQTERTDLVSGVTPFRFSTSTMLGTPLLFTSSIYDIVNNDFYFAESGQNLYQGDGLDDLSMAIAVDLDSAGTPEIQDLEIYEVNGVRKLFTVYETNGNMQVGISSLPYNTATDDLTWLTATVSGAFTNVLTNRAFMRVSDNGFAYLFQDNKIHKIDGTTVGGANGTITQNVILFPTNFQITDAVDFRGYIFAALRQDPSSNFTNLVEIFSSQVGIYVWDRRTTTVNSVDYIPLYGINSIKKIYISHDGRLRLMCVNSERILEIREYNGNTFEIIEEVGYGANFNLHDSLIVNAYATIWLGLDGYIYAHGKPHFSDKQSIFRIGQYETTNVFTSPGAILYGGANTNSSTMGFKNTRNALYLSYRNSASESYFKTWDIHGTGASGVNALPHQGDVYTLVKFLPDLSTLKNIVIYCFPGSGSGSTTAATLKFYANQSSTAFKTHLVTRAESARGYVKIELNKSYVNTIQMEIEYPSNVIIGTTDFAPSFAVLEYDSATVLK